MTQSPAIETSPADHSKPKSRRRRTVNMEALRDQAEGRSFERGVDVTEADDDLTARLDERRRGARCAAAQLADSGHRHRDADERRPQLFAAGCAPDEEPAQRLAGV